MGTSALRVGYIGELGSDRMEDFRGLLQRHFAAVHVFGLGDLGRLDLSGVDVVVVDGEWKAGGASVPDRLPLDALPLPAVLVGAIGGFVGDALGIKLGAIDGCVCLTECAIVGPSELSHPIFSGPAPVPLVEPVTIDSPDNFLAFSPVKDVPATLQVVEIHAPLDGAELDAVPADDDGAADGPPDDDSVPPWGLVTTSAGFLDSPDCEFILGGVNEKAHDYVAVGRHGRFLQWGFHGAPSEMREVGEALFVNAICYIAGFADAKCEALRVQQPRETLRIQLGLADDEGCSDLVSSLFMERQSIGTTAAEALAWFDRNRGYIRAVGGLYGRFTVDVTLRELGIANDDPKLVTTLADSLDAEGAEGERARLLWQRYLHRDVEDVAAERAWLAAMGDSMFFSDWAGYRWISRADLPELKREDEPRREGVVTGSVYAVRESGGQVVAQVELYVDHGFYIYPPGSREGVGLSFSLDAGADLRIVAPPVLDFEEPHLSQTSVRLVLDGSGDELDLYVTSQACDVQRCLMPSTMTLTCPIEPA